MLGLPMIGLSVIEMRVDAPIAMSATHLPPDPAFLQRGYLIRMFKRTPQIKDLSLLPEIDDQAKTFGKTVIVNWFKALMAMNAVYQDLANVDIDERIKDLVLPIATILSLIGKSWEFVIDYAKKSFMYAMYSNVASTAYLLALREIRDNARIVDWAYVIPYETALEIIKKWAKMLHVSMRDIKYMMQYLYAGCFTAMCDEGVCFVCDRKTLDNTLSVIPSLDEVLSEFSKGCKNIAVQMIDMSGVLEDERN